MDRMTKKYQRSQIDQVRLFNAAHPVGTMCSYWKGEREGEGMPSVQAGPEGVWLTVKLWVADSNALTMQPNVVADNGLQAAAAALPVPEVAASLAN
jgi:hypothetical protein